MKKSVLFHRRYGCFEELFDESQRDVRNREDYAEELAAHWRNR